jgi:ribosome-binding protein aMBF1 (putative translation factor)
MIKNERQYIITKSQAEKLRYALELLPDELDSRNDIHPLLKNVQLEAIKSQLNDLEDEIKEYEGLVSSRRKRIVVRSLDELPKALIKGRIMARLSQKELANKLKMKEQQIQRYESTDYASAKLSRLIEIANKLELIFDGKFQLGGRAAPRRASKKG